MDYKNRPDTFVRYSRWCQLTAINLQDILYLVLPALFSKCASLGTRVKKDTTYKATGLVRHLDISYNNPLYLVPSSDDKDLKDI